MKKKNQVMYKGHRKCSNCGAYKLKKKKDYSGTYLGCSNCKRIEKVND